MEEILKNLQQKYSFDVSVNTSQEEISVLIDALEFCENNYEHDHEGVEKYIRGNHAMQARDPKADLPQIYRNVRQAVNKDSSLWNYGHADLLTRSLLEYQRNGTPKNGHVIEKLKQILQPIL